MDAHKEEMEARKTGRTPFSFDRTFSASSECFDDESSELNASPYKTNPPSSSNQNKLHDEDLEENLQSDDSSVQNENVELNENDHVLNEEMGESSSTTRSHNDDVGINKIGVHRKKSILRHAHDQRDKVCSSNSGNSFNGSACGSSIISDGKMGSSMMNSSFNNSQFYNNFYSRAEKRNDFQRYTRGPYAPLDRCNSNSTANSTKIQFPNYYPEGGWGYVILFVATFSHALLCGFLLSGGIFATKVLDKFGHELRMESGKLRDVRQS